MSPYETDEVLASENVLLSSVLVHLWFRVQASDQKRGRCPEDEAVYSDLKKSLQRGRKQLLLSMSYLL